MTIRMRSVFLALCLFGSAFAAFAQDAPHIVDSARNPPPSSPLNAYGHFELAPIEMGAPWAGQKGNEAAKTMLQGDLDERVKPVLDEWNAKGGDKTLRIVPQVRYIRFITGGKRFWGGGFAGNSGILLQVSLVDAATGATVAQPEFYQHANAVGAAWSFGATDKTMLLRVANMIRAYLRDNYAQAVGGAIAVAPESKD